MTEEKIAARLFELDPDIRYVAVNQRGRIVEMEQNPKLEANVTDVASRVAEMLSLPL